MANNDIWEIVDRQTFMGQDIQNVYFYRADKIGNTGDAEDLANSWNTNVLPTIAYAQVAEVLHTAIEVRNLFNPADNFTLAISRPGNQGAATDALPTFTAYPFRLIQGNGGVKNGSKRLAGVMENWQVDGVVTNADGLDILGDAADIMLDSIGNGAFIDIWYPVIVKRILDGGSYRLPESIGEAVFGVLTDVIFDVLITSQTSRKIGVGA